MSKATNRQINCAAKLKTLADATRLHVVRELMRGAQSVGELNRVIGLPQSLLSHHLKVLRSSGVVTAERVGKAVLYQLAPGVGQDAASQTLNLGCCALSFPTRRHPAAHSPV